MEFFAGLRERKLPADHRLGVVAGGLPGRNRLLDGGDRADSPI